MGINLPIPYPLIPIMEGEMQTELKLFAQELDMTDLLPDEKPSWPREQRVAKKLVVHRMKRKARNKAKAISRRANRS